MLKRPPQTLGKRCVQRLALGVKQGLGPGIVIVEDEVVLLFRSARACPGSCARASPSRALARAGVQVPVSDDRFVIFTYLAVRKLDVPDEAWAKVRPTKSAPAR